MTLGKTPAAQFEISIDGVPRSHRDLAPIFHSRTRPLHAEAHGPLVSRFLRNGAARWWSSQDGGDEQMFGTK